MMKTGNSSFILDTNIVIDLFKGKRNLAYRMDAADHIFLPFPTLGELFLGAESSKRKVYHLEQVNSLLKQYKALLASLDTVKIYGKLKSHLKRKGTLIPENDMWIAAIALEYGFPVVTRDKHFKTIPGLEVVEW